MPAEKTAFRVSFEGPIADFSRRHPASTISLWCNWDCEVLSIVGATPAQAQELRDVVAKHSPWTEAHALTDGAHVIVMKCVDLPHDEVNALVDQAHCVNVPPTRFQDGWEHYEVLSFDEEKTRWLFAQLKGKGRAVELLRKRRLNTQALLNTRSLGVNALFAGLTEKQAHSMLLAFEHGYYDSPKKTTAAAIAVSRGLSRSTFEEHLRKAENTLVQNLVPYLELYVRSAISQAQAPPAPGGDGGEVVEAGGGKD